MPHWTQVVLLPVGSVSSPLTHSCPSLPSPRIFLEEAEIITAIFFHPFPPFLTCSTTPGHVDFFSSSQTNPLAALPTSAEPTLPLNTGQVCRPYPYQNNRTEHGFTVPIIAHSLKPTQTNLTNEGQGHTCYRSWQGGEFLTFRCLCCPCCQRHMPGMARVPGPCLALGLIAGALRAQDR